MNATCFVDTNVLVYARDAGETDKQPLAEAWLETLWRQRQGRLSYQVLQEYYVTVTRKLRPGIPVEDARDEVDGRSSVSFRQRQQYLPWNPVQKRPQHLELSYHTAVSRDLNFRCFYIFQYVSRSCWQKVAKYRLLIP